MRLRVKLVHLDLERGSRLALRSAKFKSAHEDDREPSTSIASFFPVQVEFAAAAAATAADISAVTRLQL